MGSLEKAGAARASSQSRAGGASGVDGDISQKSRSGEKQRLSIGDRDPEDDDEMGFYVYLKKHWLAVITYCAVFWSFGMCVAFLGPTLLDLGCMTGSDMQAISWVFFAQLLCSLIGASMAGYIVERCDANYIILVAAVVIPVSMFVIPFCKVLPALAVVLAVMGLNMGIIDCLANLQMIKIFGDAVPPFLQAMHFCYGFGAFVSPMIAEPFLLNEDCSPFIDNNTMPSASSGLLEPTIQEVQNDSSLPAHSLAEAQVKSQVHYAFWIMAATQMPVPFLVLTLVIRRKMRGVSYKHHQLVESDSSPSPTHNAPAKNQYGTIGVDTDKFDNVTSKNWCISSTNHVIIITVGTAAMLFIYDGLQSAYGGYIYSFAVKSIADLNKTEGAYLNALFWGTFALGRLLSIPLATRFSPPCMLLTNVVGSTLALSLMLALQHDHNALYVGTCMFGLFLSSVAPTALSLAEKFIDLSSKITSVIVAVAAIGEMVCPVIVGNMFVKLGPVSFLGFSETMCLLSIIVFFIIWFVGRNSAKYQAKGPSTFVWCQVGYARPIPRDTDIHHVTTTHHVKYYHQMSTESSGTIEMTNVKTESDRNNHENNWDDKAMCTH